VHSSPAALTGVSNTVEAPARPDDATVATTTKRTKAALDKLMTSRAGQTQTDMAATAAKRDAEFIQYTSSSTQQTRLVKMVEAQVDPMEPPKFKHKKLPRGPPSPPPPVLHSPTRKATADEQKEWYIPPSISNWKNRHGYTIPLDKRLAADGRGLAEHTINDNFSKLSEALFIADKHAREEVQLRAKMQTELAERERDAREEGLRRLAMDARSERARIGGQSAAPRATSVDSRGSTPSRSPTPDAQHRDEIRKQRARVREKELRTRKDVKDRDVSEKIALGIARPTAHADTLYDARLFNRTEGVGNPLAVSDDSYNVYDKPLFDAGASEVYRPTRTAHDPRGVDTAALERLTTPSTRFAAPTHPHTTAVPGPVQFERAPDPFGVDVFLNTAKRATDDAADAPHKRSK